MTEPATTTPGLAAPPVDSIVALTRELIGIPSRGGEDSCDPIIDKVVGWLTGHGVPTTVLKSDAGDRVAVVGEVIGAAPGPTYVQDACLDTAPYGDIAAWESPPDEPRIADGWLYGRGAADSKVAVAIFSHLAAAFQQRRDSLSGRLVVLFDADEHTGRFAGVKAFLRDYPDVDGVMIGYPGNYGVVIGARGFYRATITLHGIGGHSGGRRARVQNAVEKAAELVRRLGDASLPETTDEAFPLAPSVTVTAINGGSSFSMVPDQCTVNVDVRLTPRFDAAEARRLVREAVAEVDRLRPGRALGSVTEAETWPAYRLPDDAPIVRALVGAAREAHRPTVAPVVCGPSNVGNYFAAYEIDATCGFGVSYEGVHAPNERIAVESVAAVCRTYEAAVVTLLGTPV